MPNLRINYPAILLGLGCIVLLCMLISTCNKIKDVKQQSINTINALNDSIHSINDSTVRGSVIQTTTTNQFTELKLKDSTIKELQKVVAQYKSKLKSGNAVVNTKVETKVENTNKTKVVIPDLADIDTTFRIDSTFTTHGNSINFSIHNDPINTWYVKVSPEGKVTINPKYMPTYRDSINNEWVDYKAVMNADSSTLSLKIRNSYSTILGTEKGKPFVDIINHNPYSETTSVRSYQVDLPKSKKFGLGFHVGVTYFNNAFRPVISAGINYSPIRF